MKLTKNAFAAALLLTCTGLRAQSQSPSTPSPVMARPAAPLIVSKPELVNGSTLPSDTGVWLTFDQPVDSRTVRQGDRLPMRVSRDVMLGNYVVIPHGTPARGMVSYRTGKGAFGKSGKLEFDLTDVMLPDRTVSVSGHYRIEGNGNTGATIGTALAVGVFSAFVKGHSAIVPVGSEWKASTKEAIPISLADAPAAAAPAGGVIVTKTN